jgi:transposase
VRVDAAFNRLLGFSGTIVEKVAFHATLILVTVRLCARRRRCPCGQVSTAADDRSRRSWRHLDLGRFKVVVRAQVRRVDCRDLLAHETRPPPAPGYPAGHGGEG